MTGRGPLAGRTVVELAGLGPAPFACMAMADLGAEVIRVDRPGPDNGPGAPSAADVLNRGKRSIVLDLKQPSAVDAVLTLCESADVLVEGYRPGVAERLGLGPDVVAARNPALVYGRMTGWGQDGPIANSAGHDIGYIAVTGALHAIGEAGGPPRIPLNLVGDFGGGATYLVIGILAGLLDADRTGRGQIVDAAIVDGTSHLLAAIHSMLGSGRWVDERGANLLDGGAPYYSVYETADGRHMAVGAIEPKFFAELLRLLDIGPAELDAAAQQDRSAWPQHRELFAARFRSRSRDEWTAVFDGTDACVAPVLSLREATDHPQVAARGSVIETDGVVQPGTAPRFSAHPAGPPKPPPARGGDTAEILRRAGVDVDALLYTSAAFQNSDE
ncbi:MULTISPECIES: CaiB/BaiF CoA-transferase family protein [unclassified Pseudonocardia]|uniref:CaiB/BaiF CoA transferase family protein n=1 Tax=unclassified Pseudonocardia TaxID=2619320 RepID=UPI0001FFDDF5|nr:CaiB/BaiF CoA-transferase family protein [Pseudonocardia sp. Ae707_Ps1]OLM16775.1 Alpha-methylacyl-CoA racemase [Pseudonocardia sp. Ae707_Ps1]